MRVRIDWLLAGSLVTARTLDGTIPRSAYVARGRSVMKSELPTALMKDTAGQPGPPPYETGVSPLSVLAQQG
jgi:hypothetical protein